MSSHPTAETPAEAIVPPQQPSPLEPSPQEQPPQTLLPLGILNVLDESVNEPTPWIIENFLAEGEQMLVFGAPKVGKSQFALQLACCLAMGEPFLGWPVPVRKKVLYLNFEMGKRSFMMRIARHVSRLLVEREKRQCEEGGFEYMGEDYPWHNSDEDLPLEDNLRKKINDEIRDRLFFCGDFKSLEGDHVPKPTESLNKNQGVISKPDPEAREELLVCHWQSVIEAVKPDLVIFDTLSKTHSINESENSEIQRVLMRIREICRMPEDMPDGENEFDAAGSERGGGRQIAHLIVHHARKSSKDSNEGNWNRTDLDSIRGGSAIRAEADVICGIFYANRKPTATHEETNRHLVFEARNLAPDDQPLNFAKFAFVPRRQRNPAEVEAEKEAASEAARKKDNELDQLILELIRNAFVQKGMRGLKISTLEKEVSTGLDDIGKTNVFSGRGLNRKLKDLARRADSPFEIRVKKGKEEETAKFPHERDNGPKLYWIKDGPIGMSWLNEEPLKTAIVNHKPYSVRKARDQKAEGGN
jgi:hypothetical protein